MKLKEIKPRCLALPRTNSAPRPADRATVQHFDLSLIVMAWQARAHTHAHTHTPRSAQAAFTLAELSVGRVPPFDGLIRGTALH